ncbi:MAG: RIP metalloprotease RseP [Rikenellaceae bacterium]
MEVLIQALQLILSLSLLVAIHEFGHFAFAKIFGARVEKFYLFFDPWFSIFKFKKGETEYGMGWIPFGGYVKISGMIDESMDKEQLKQEPQPYEFRSKPAWQRLLIMIGGVMMNLLLAIAIYAGISYTNGSVYVDNKDVTDGYYYSETAQKMGFRNGDKIINVGGEEISNYREIAMAILFNDVDFVEIERQGIRQQITIDKTYFSELLSKDNFFLELRLPKAVVSSVLSGSPAEMAGLQEGDKIVAVDSVSFKYFDEFKDIINSKAGDTVLIAYQRNIDGTPTTIERQITIASDSLIGFVPQVSMSVDENFYNITEINYTLLESIPQGLKLAFSQIDNYIKQLKLIFSPETQAYKSVGSVVSMGGMFSTSWDWLRFWSITAFLSVVLAIMNILPIPALDGGHVLFLIYELVTRRKPSDKFMEYAQTAGMILLFGLMFLALGNDIYKLFQ